MSTTSKFLAARNAFLAFGCDPELACEHLALPSLEQFNWAIDFFDVMARKNSTPALITAGDAGVESRVTFQDLSNRSNQVANWMASVGVERGDRVLLMTGKARSSRGIRAAAEDGFRKNPPRRAQATRGGPSEARSSATG